jgi:hypothetical protein
VGHATENSPSVRPTDPLATRTADRGSAVPHPVSDIASVHNEHHLVIALELPRAGGQLLGHPNVVLVAPGNNIAAREASGVQEVLRRPETLCIAHNTHLKGCA